MKPYPKYKDSGIEWLGEVPEGWPAKRLRFCLKLNPSKQEIRHLPKDTELPFIPMEAVGEAGSLDLSNTRPIDDVENGYTFFRNNDVAIAKITPCFENGKGCIFRNLVHDYGFGTTELTVMRPRHLDPAFLYYLTISHQFRVTGIGLMQGSAGQKRVPDDYIRDYIIGLPSEAEQQAIATFLDQETAKIDALIQKKERMIELLKEKRVALITQAVTKGLDPNVPMKDSGIEWLGEVPEHWDIKKLKHVSTYMVSNVDKKTQEGETTIRLFNYTDVYNNEFLTNEMDLMVASAPPGQLDNFIVYTDDVLITKDSEDWKDIAKPALVKSTAPDILCGYHLAMIRPIRGISTGKFLFRALQSTLINQQFQIASNGVTRYGLPKSAIGESLITLPSIKEQHEIASHIDQETSKIDNLTSKIISSITLLREYRSSLINAAVTGKIDLREAL